ncbi:MAG: type I restriction enzyme HsdR N-terminal domain-containing protein [Deltaproteobacteria bacterium]|nr:type I restriction enzyme HsdR N-terminal domain-containing protein [Deltaproteobacteria bacterium]
MDANQLVELVQRYRENRDFIANEETAKMTLVVPFIRLLGYDPSTPREVRPEFAAEFTQADGKRQPDRMDFAIFDKTGSKPLLVIETKPLGTDLASKANQLARYIAQVADLHFGIITDGCHYLFYGDLESQNQMDREPFFTFSLDDPNADWTKVAKFLSKFSRDAFNAETLVTDAENSRYRQAMVEKLAKVLKAPAEDEGFLKWLTEDVYKGLRTKAVMSRLGEVAREAVEPALLRVIGEDFLSKLRERIQESRGPADRQAADPATAVSAPAAAVQPAPSPEEPMEERQRVIETSAEEMQFFDVVRDICVKAGTKAEEILSRDTVNYFNVSIRRPTKWFLRYFVTSKRRYIATWVPTTEARVLAPGFEVEDAPAVWGVSRVYLDGPAQLWAIKALVLRSLELAQARKDDAPEPPAPTT